jgi:A/G-specific adenine glycosylase
MPVLPFVDYSRAKRLLAAAKKTVAEYDGILPSSPKELEKEIPGIGPYTAGAIASIAYNVQAPLVRPYPATTATDIPC